MPRTARCSGRLWHMKKQNRYKDVLEGKGELYIQPDTVLRAVKVIDAIRESHASGKSISCEI